MRAFPSTPADRKSPDCDLLWPVTGQPLADIIGSSRPTRLPAGLFLRVSDSLASRLVAGLRGCLAPWGIPLSYTPVVERRVGFGESDGDMNPRQG